jgi:hypothetical protein
MRARIKVSAFTQGVTVADCCAACWSGSFRRRTHHERIRFACRERGTGCAARTRSPARPAMPLTRVRWPTSNTASSSTCASANPRTLARPLAALRGVPAGAMFCRIRWQANDYGTIRWQLMVMQHAAGRGAAHPRRAAGAPAAARRRRCQRARRAGTHRRHRRAAIDVSPAYWRTLGNRLAARLRCPNTPPSGILAGREGADDRPDPPRRGAASLAPARSHRAGGLAVGLAALAWAASLPRLTYNPSDSVAVGWYRIDPFDPRRSLPRPLSVDSIVLVPLPASCRARCAARLPADAFRCSNVGAVAPQHVCIVAGHITACLRPPCCLPTGWAGRCHPCSFAAALNRANCSC